jgi:hypothetical protein
MRLIRYEEIKFCDLPRFDQYENELLEQVFKKMCSIEIVALSVRPSVRHFGVTGGATTRFFPATQ